MRVTLKKIAEKAQVSVSTTSRALSGHPAISAETLARVQEAADELEYERPNSTGRYKDSRQILAGRNIGVISIGLDRSLTSMPVITNAFRGVEATLMEFGANVRITDMPDLGKLPGDVRLETLDGAILTGPMVDYFKDEAQTPVVNVLRKIPSVWVVGRPKGGWGDVVAANDFLIGSRAAEHFVKNGHKHLAFLNTMPENELFRLREDGMTSMARRLGADVQSFCKSPKEGWSLPLKSPMAFELVQELVQDMLNATPRPTAVLAAADSVAALMYCVFGIHGLRVGHDISVIGGNNTPELMTVPYPHLTTFDIRAEQLGKLAVRQLAAKLNDHSADTEDIDIFVEPRFISGQSVQNLNESEAG